VHECGHVAYGALNGEILEDKPKTSCLLSESYRDPKSWAGQSKRVPKHANQ
jgi:hypothetical protein